MQTNRLPFNPPGKKLGNYRFQNEIGRGNYGVVHTVTISKVYLASDERGERYAIKCIKKEIFTENGGIIGELIHNEKNALLKVKDKNVIRMYEYIESVNQSYMIFELCDTCHFETYLQAKQFKITIYEAIQYFKQIVSGVKALHANRIIHRDLKLSNILLKDFTTIKIADLGFCHILSENETQVKLNLGTLGTKAPEIIEQQPYGLQVDMFSAGVIFYQMLCGGMYPFQPTTEIKYLEEIKQGSGVINFAMCNKRIPDQLRTLVISMLQYNPEQRLKWSQLFKHQLFAPECPELIMETYLGYNSRVDHESTRKFYEDNQDWLNSLVASPKFNPLSNMIHQITQKTTNFSYKSNSQDSKETRDIIISDILQNNAEMSFSDNRSILQSIVINEKNELFEKYLSRKRFITLHFRIYYLIHQTTFTSQRQNIFPAFLLAKKIFELNSNLIKLLESKENIFNSPSFPVLIQSPEWELLLKDINSSKQLIFDQILHYQNTVKKNLDKMKYIDKDWEVECETQFPSQDFPRIFSLCIDKYINFVMTDVFQSNPKSQNRANKQICFLYLVSCLTEKAYFDYEDEQYSVEQLQANDVQLNTIYEKVCQSYFQQQP